MSGILANWGPQSNEWPKYQQYLSNTPVPTGPCLAGITSLTFRHTEFIGTGGVYLQEAQDLQTISFPNLTAITTVQRDPPSTDYILPLMWIDECPNLTTVSYPVLSAVGGYRAAESFLIEDNPLLTEIDLPALSLTTPLESAIFRFWFNALSQSCVDNILIRLAAAPVPSGYKELRLNGGTNSAPSPAGVAAAATLAANGWFVTTN